MTIFWERCGICNRPHVTRSCWLRADLSVCPYCCLACPKRQQCPRPAWFAELRQTALPKPRPREPSKAVKALEELLKKLEGG